MDDSPSWQNNVGGGDSLFFGDETNLLLNSPQSHPPVSSPLPHITAPTQPLHLQLTAGGTRSLNHNVASGLNSSASIPFQQHHQQQQQMLPDLQQNLIAALNSLQSSLNSLSDQMHRRFEDLENMIDDLDEKFVVLDEKLDRMSHNGAEHSGNSNSGTPSPLGPLQNSSPNFTSGSVSGGITKYYCEKHRQQFASSSNYYRHMREVHGRERRKKVKQHIKRRRVESEELSQGTSATINSLASLLFNPQIASSLKLHQPQQSQQSQQSHQLQQSQQAQQPQGVPLSSFYTQNVFGMAQQEGHLPASVEAMPIPAQSSSRAQHIPPAPQANASQLQQQSFLSGFYLKTGPTVVPVTMSYGPPCSTKLYQMFKDLQKKEDSGNINVERILFAKGTTCNSPIVISDNENDKSPGALKIQEQLSSKSHFMPQLECKHLLVNLMKRSKDADLPSSGELSPMNVQIPSDDFENPSSTADPWLIVFTEEKSALKTVVLQVENLYSASLYIVILMYDVSTQGLACIYPKKLATLDSVSDFKKVKPKGKIALEFPLQAMPLTDDPDGNSMLQFLVVAATDVNQLPQLFADMKADSEQCVMPSCMMVRRVLFLTSSDNKNITPAVVNDVNSNQIETGLEQTLQKLTFDKEK